MLTPIRADTVLRLRRRVDPLNRDADLSLHATRQLSGLDAQELLETRVLKVGGRDQPIKYASIFDRDDNMRVASNAKSFEVSCKSMLFY